VYDHDFNTFSNGVVIPHGIYDVKLNEGYIILGNSKDTSEFCCGCIKDWWEKFGKENMKIVFDDYLGKWNYRAIPEGKT